MVSVILRIIRGSNLRPPAVYRPLQGDFRMRKGASYMGIYLNPGAKKLEKSMNSEIYVDKSGMLAVRNKLLKRMLCREIQKTYDNTTVGDGLEGLD